MMHFSVMLSYLACRRSKRGVEIARGERGILRIGTGIVGQP